MQEAAQLAGVAASPEAAPSHAAFGGMSATSTASLNEARLEVRDLAFFFGDNKVLKGIDLAFPDRQVTAMIGPSGCGKTTLLRVLNRMYSLYPGQRATGQVLLDGFDILDRRTDLNWLRRHVGMVFQKPTPFPMSIYDNIAFGVRLHEKLSKAAMDERVQWALSQAALWDETKDRLHRSALGLSGGQQQRLCIARTIAVKPQVILLDEATSALDPISTAKIEELIDELKQDYTIVMVTHNLQQAARVGDQVAFLFLGELVEAGPALDIFTNPRQARTQEYVTGRFG